MILCWPTFTASLGCKQPWAVAGHICKGFLGQCSLHNTEKFHLLFKKLRIITIIIKLLKGFRLK